MAIRLKGSPRTKGLQEIVRALPDAEETASSVVEEHPDAAGDNLPPRLLSLRETAEWLCVSLSTVKRLITRNELVTVRVGTRRKVPATSLEAYISRAARPLRIPNFQALTIGQSLCWDGRQYRIVFSARQIKTGGDINEPVPDDLVRYLEAFLKVWRPVMLRQAAKYG